MNFIPEKNNKSQIQLIRLARSGVLITVGLLFTNFASFFFNTFLARLLGPSEFGLFSLGYAIFCFGSAISLFGLDKAIIHFESPYFEKGELSHVKFVFLKIIKLSFLLSIVVTVIFYLSSTIIALKFVNNFRFIAIIKLFSFSIPAYMFSVVFYSSLQAFRDVKRQIIARNFIEPTVKLLGLSLMYFLSYFVQPKAIWSVVVMISGYILSSCYEGFSIYKTLKPQISDRPKGWRYSKVLKYSLPLLFTDVLNLGFFRLDIFFLSMFYGEFQVGIYSAAFQLSNLGILFLTAANLVFAPSIASYAHANDMRLLNDMFKSISRWILILTLPILSIVLLFSREIMSIFGPEYVRGEIALIILMFGQLVSNFCGISGTMLTMTGHSGVVLFNSITTCIFSMFLCYLIIPRYGLLGAAVSAASTISFFGILRVFQAYRLLGSIPFEVSLLKPIGSTILSICIIKVFCYFFWTPSYWLDVLLIVPFYLTLYFLIILFCGLESQDKAVLNAFKKSIVRHL